MFDPVDAIQPDYAVEREPLKQLERTASEWAVASFDVGLWELDVATFDLKLSMRAGELLGVSPGHSTCDALMAAMHPLDRDMIPAAINRAVEPGSDGHFQVDFRVEDIDGNIRWIDSRAHIIVEGAPRQPTVYLRGAMLDITERKRIEERSRQSEAHLRIATEAALFFSWEIDLATNSHRSSRNVRDVVGFDMPTTLTDVWAMIHQNDRPAFGAALTTAIKEFTSFSTEFRLLHPATGASAWLSSSGVALPGVDGAQVRVVGVTQNITDRKQAEATLRESEERYRTLFESITEGFSIIEKMPTAPGTPSTYAFVEANAVFERRVGQGSIAGKPVNDPFPFVSQRWFDTFDAILTTGAPIRLQDAYQFKGAVLDIKIFRIEDQTQKRIGILVVDITEQHNAELMREAALATTEQARAEAVAAIAVRDQFMQIASHELRTPLTSLLGYARMLESGMVHRPEMIAPVAQLITRQAQRLDTQVGQMLDTSRLERGQFAIDPVPIDLDALVMQVVDEFRLTLSISTRHRLQFHTADRPLLVLADANRLTQVFQNLLTNAVKYSPFGSPLHIRIYYTAADALVEVTDHGIGIAPDAQSHIFEAFYRADNAGSIASGFGLGLHVTQAIVSRHGGRIEIESTIGEGSTFRVLLPRLLAISDAPFG